MTSWLPRPAGTAANTSAMQGRFAAAQPSPLDSTRGAIFQTLGEVPARIQHKEICRVLMRMNRYGEVCVVFHDTVSRSAKSVAGEPQLSYPVGVGEKIIVDFNEHWDGCPQETCEGGFGEVGPDAT